MTIKDMMWRWIPPLSPSFMRWWKILSFTAEMQKATAYQARLYELFVHQVQLTCVQKMERCASVHRASGEYK